MLLSLALIFIIGVFLAELFGAIRLPKFMGMILTGILLGPFVLNLISSDILNISDQIRKIALIIILLRAGLHIDFEDLKKIGKSALIISFVSASFEIAAVTIFAPMLFDITHLEAAILGTVLAAVSPAVVVPKMIQLKEQKYGQKHSIPQMIMASASVDDVYVIVLFTAFISMYHTGAFDAKGILMIPVEILLGILVGILVGYILHVLFETFHMRDTVKVMVVLAVSMLLVYGEDPIGKYIHYSSLLSVMVLGITYLYSHRERAKRLAAKLDRVWVFAELLLFVLVGAAVDISVIKDAGLFALILIAVELLFRFIGVQLAVMKSKCNRKEKVFIGISFLPKATVQAAIGGVPLALGIANGSLILSIAVLMILVSAPIGAILLDVLKPKLLTVSEIDVAETELMDIEII